jgi:copper transport protein
LLRCAGNCRARDPSLWAAWPRVSQPFSGGGILPRSGHRSPTMRVAARLALALAAAMLGFAVLAAAASGHAKLLGSTPKAGQVLERSPRAVVLVFDEAIDAEFVRLQVQDSAGRRVDRAEPYHPGGRDERLAVRLELRLEGRYVASYRVISEDGHPVVKRSTFRVRPPRPMGQDEEMKAAPPQGGAMPDDGADHAALETGGVTDTAFAVARGLGYLAIALAVGGVVFLFIAWLPALAHVAGGGAAWLGVSESFIRLLKRILLVAVLLGLTATASAIVFEAATATGASFWAALDRDALDAVADTRVVRAWTVRLGVWVLLGVLVVLVLRSRRVPVLRRAALGAAGTAPGPTPSVPQVLLVGGAMVALALTASMAGHSATYSPSGLLVSTDTVHVLSVSAWLGGLVMLLLAVPVAARPLRRRERIPLFAGVVARFSRLAIVAVALLLLAGIVQSVVLVGALDDFVGTAYGRLVLAKIALLLVLVSLGAYNQRRLLPRLRMAESGVEEPERAAALLRRSVAFEVGLALIVLAVTSVLVATQPATAA